MKTNRTKVNRTKQNDSNLLTKCPHQNRRPQKYANHSLSSCRVAQPVWFKHRTWRGTDRSRLECVSSANCGQRRRTLQKCPHLSTRALGLWTHGKSKTMFRIISALACLQCRARFYCQVFPCNWNIARARLLRGWWNHVFQGWSLNILRPSSHLPYF
jgi:hypothetical protein